jgi:hypothetical protein
MRQTGEVNPGTFHPLNPAVMSRIGIDISGPQSDLMDECFSAGIDSVFTVCDRVKKSPYSHEILTF